MKRKKEQKVEFQSYCKECDSKRRMEWNKNNPEKAMASRKRNANWKRDYMLRYRYGISLEEVKLMLEKQNYKCPICSTLLNKLDSPKRNKQNTYIDHSHKTGKVRGILCNLCNVAIGSLRDNPNFAYHVYEYLRKYE